MSLPAIQITLNGDYHIDFIQALEKEFDKALNHNGFTRIETTKGDNTAEIKYRQFAYATGDPK